MGTDRRLNLQFTLTSKFLDDCAPGDPCDYHRDRATSSLHLLPVLCPEESDASVDRFKAPLGPELRAVCRDILEKSCPPAGSWALVGSQREWIVKRLYEAYAAAPEDHVHHAVAGVASHVHMIGTVLVAAEALRSIPGRRVTLTFYDGHAAPLEEIEALLPMWRKAGGPGLFGGRKLPTSWGKLPIHSSVREQLAQNFPTRILVETHEQSLEQRAGMPSGAFDVLTEHFVSSMYWKGGYTDQIRALRAAYFDYLRPGGRLICADGLTNRTEARDYDAFVEGHRESGFEPGEGSGYPVWDIYGHSIEDIEEWLDPGRARTTVIEKGNTLSVFVRQDGK